MQARVGCAAPAMPSGQAVRPFRIEVPDAAACPGPAARPEEPRSCARELKYSILEQMSQALPGRRAMHSHGRDALCRRPPAPECVARLVERAKWLRGSEMVMGVYARRLVRTARAAAAGAIAQHADHVAVALALLSLDRNSCAPARWAGAGRYARARP